MTDYWLKDTLDAAVKDVAEWPEWMRGKKMSELTEKQREWVRERAYNLAVRFADDAGWATGHNSDAFRSALTEAFLLDRQLEQDMATKPLHVRIEKLESEKAAEYERGRADGMIRSENEQYAYAAGLAQGRREGMETAISACIKRGKACESGMVVLSEILAAIRAEAKGGEVSERCPYCGEHYGKHLCNPTPQIAALTAERDALKAEVERLKEATPVDIDIEFPLPKRGEPLIAVTKADLTRLREDAARLDAAQEMGIELFRSDIGWCYSFKDKGSNAGYVDIRSAIDAAREPK